MTSPWISEQQLEKAELSWDQLLQLIDLSLSIQSKSLIAKENLEYGKVASKCRVVSFLLLLLYLLRCCDRSISMTVAYDR